MKLDERRFGELTRRLSSYRVVLVHGDEPGVVAERMAAILAALPSGSEGGMGHIELDGSEHARAPAAIDSPMLGQSATFVRLRHAGDPATASVERVLDGAAPGLLLIDAPALPPRSKLRALVEKHERGASLACRAPDARDLAARIERRLTELGIRLEPGAQAFLGEHGALFGGSGPEIERLLLYVAGSRSVGVEALEAFVRESEEGSLEDLAFAVAGRNPAQVDRLLRSVLEDGTAPVAVLRVMLGHFARLRLVRLAVERGIAMDEAMGTLRPPVFFSRVGAMRQAVSRWSAAELDRACAALWQADRRCRETGAPAEALAAGVLARLGDG